jgi:hypothetical protein
MDDGEPVGLLQILIYHHDGRELAVVSILADFSN